MAKTKNVGGKGSDTGLKNLLNEAAGAGLWDLAKNAFTAVHSQFTTEKGTLDSAKLQVHAPGLVHNGTHQADLANIMSLVLHGVHLPIEGDPNPLRGDPHAHWILVEIWFPSIKNIFEDMQITLHNQVCSAGDDTELRHRKRVNLARELIAVAYTGTGLADHIADDNLARNKFARSRGWGSKLFDHNYNSEKIKNFFALPAPPIEATVQRPTFIETIREMGGMVIGKKP